MNYPCFIQKDSKDCGPACLKNVAKYYGKNIPLSYLREVCYTQRTGTTMLGLSEGADTIGFNSVCMALSWKQFSAKIPLPCIIHWNNDHFVVVYSVTEERIIIADPGYGILKYKKDIFLKCWLHENSESEVPVGTVLLLEPTTKFYDNKNHSEDTQPSFKYLFGYVRLQRKLLLQLMLSLGIASIVSLAFPFLTQAIVDIGIGNKDLNFIVLVLIAQVLLVFGQMMNSFVRGWVMLHMTMRLDISLISDFLNKLMRLPISFFDTKLIGDIMQRIGDFGRVRDFLTSTAIEMFMALIVFVVYGCIMSNYDWTILYVFMSGSVLYLAWVLIFMKRRRKLEYIRFQEASLEESNMIQLITGMQEIKLNNCEKKKRWEWERIQVKLYYIGIKDLSLQQTQEIGSTFINQTKNVIISFLAVQAVVNGELTLGMMMSIQYIIGQLNAPVAQFVGFMQSAQEAKISLERLDEIQSKKEEEPQGEEKLKEITNNQDIIFENVSYCYNGPRSHKVLDNINFKVEKGKITAIVGTSGSGKTTLLKLLLGFYKPLQGQIWLGQVPLMNYSESEWRRKCGVVMQEGFIFYDTVTNNIALTDEDADMNRVRSAIDTACASDFVFSLPLGLNTKVGADGHGLSSGQKQRLLIARAIYKNAPYLFLDEATNSLDANNELKIMEKLSGFFQGKTVLVVAHRLSTVKNADKIIVLDQGRIVEEGKHENLVALKGYYYNLVSNQLELGR